ncbi:MAG: hypothetical protein ACK5V3_01765 [Bdellovibrionales bacterium]
MEIDKDILQLIVICLVFGLVMLWISFRKHKKLRLVQDHPTVKIETAAQGFSEVQGFAWPTVNGPKCFKGIEMIYHHLQLQKKVTEGSGKNKKKVWRTIFSTGFGAPFYVMDATGLALVEPGKSELEVDSKTTRSWYFMSYREKQYYLKNFIKESVVGFPPSEFLWGLFSSSYRIVESRINTGSPIYIKGHFESPEGIKKEALLVGLAKFAGQVFDFQSRKIRQLNRLLDVNQDNQVTNQEAIQGYSQLAMHSKSQSESGTNPVPDRPFPVFGLFVTNEDHKLFIADCHEEHLLKKLKLQFYGYLSAGIAFCLIPALLQGLQFYQTNKNERDLAVLSSASGQVEASSRGSTSKTSAVSKAINSAELHQLCLSGQLTACKEMLKNQSSLQLSDQYINLYRNKACDLGESVYCK